MGCFYIAELCIKLANHRFYFFVNRDAKWNNFDVLLVAIGIFDILQQVLGKEFRNWSFMRVARMLKVTKVFRMVRGIRFMSQMQVMLHSCVRSMSMLFWCSVMLAFVWWLLSLVLLQGVIGYLEDGRGSIPRDERVFIADNFSSLYTSMRLLFQLGT